MKCAFCGSEEDVKIMCGNRGAQRPICKICREGGRNFELNIKVHHQYISANEAAAAFDFVTGELCLLNGEGTTEQYIEEVFHHEDLHRILFNLLGWKTSRELDCLCNFKDSWFKMPLGVPDF